jgi:hypothetical protein
MKTRLWRKENERGENVFCFGAFVVLFRRDFSPVPERKRERRSYEANNLYFLQKLFKLLK